MPDTGVLSLTPPATRPAILTARRPHVCFVAPTAWPVLSGNPDIGVIGGAEVQQSILARLLVRAGYPVSMICLDYGQAQRVAVNGVWVHKIHRPEAGWPVVRFIHPRMTSMWQAMAEVNADIYYQRAAGMLTAVVAAFCRRRHKKSIYAGASDHDFLPGHQDIRYRRDRWLFERGLRQVDRLVVQNATQQTYCREHYGLASTLIASCYELPADARPGAGNTVLWVGSMHRNKRPEIFLELARRLPQFRFVLIGGPGGGQGDGEFFAGIQQAAKQLPNVECTGFLPLPQVEPYFDRAAILVNTSTHEGVPNTFLQAWARGIPTIALVDIGARLDGVPVYRVARDAEDMASEIERLFADEIYRRRSTTRCRDYFARAHSPAGVVAQYARLFDELSQGGEHGAS